MIQISNWKEDIAKEKSLWQVYCAARKFKATTFNRILRFTIILTLVSFCVINEFYFNRSLVGLRDLAETIRSWADAGIGFASQVLGFLVAGFTIFATLTKPTLFIALAKSSQPTLNVSGLKYIFFNFMFVFIHYISFLFLCVAIKMFAAPNGITTVALRRFSAGTEDIKAFIIYACFIIVGFWFLNLLILLKSFVWNVYQSVVLSIVFEGDRIDEEAAARLTNGTAN